MSHVVKEVVNQGVAVTHATYALGLSRASFYRLIKPLDVDVERAPKPPPSRKLGEDERQEVLDLLHSPHFINKTPYTPSSLNCSTKMSVTCARSERCTVSWLNMAR